MKKSTNGSELITRKETAIENPGVKYILSVWVVSMKGVARIFRNNERMTKSLSLPKPELKN